MIFEWLRNHHAFCDIKTLGSLFSLFFRFLSYFLVLFVMYGVTQLWKVKLINSSVLLEVLYIYLTDVYFTNSDFSF